MRKPAENDTWLTLFLCDSHKWEPEVKEWVKVQTRDEGYEEGKE